MGQKFSTVLVGIALVATVWNAAGEEIDCLVDVLGAGNCRTLGEGAGSALEVQLNNFSQLRFCSCGFLVLKERL